MLRYVRMSNEAPPQTDEAKRGGGGEASLLERRGVRIVDTFAEAFDMRAARVVITAQSPAWARTAAQSMTGFATSVIGCKVEAGIEADLLPEETPDGRPGVSVLLFGFDAAGLGSRLVDRVGQTVLTCPTTACFDGLPQATERVIVGGSLRHFGDRFQSSKFLDGLRYWRIPVMEGEFLVQEAFGVQKAIGGGNFLILAKDQKAALSAAEAAVDLMRRVPGVILPFPGGIVRAGSKVGAKRYKKMIASTNDAYCPTLRGRVGVTSQLPGGVSSVLEIVVDGLDRPAIEQALRVGIEAACRPGVVEIAAGNYGGKLGKHHFHLHELLS
jgi:formylmethanofuran--tetrahydromethanopterin N-formyltransferase